MLRGGEEEMGREKSERLGKESESCIARRVLHFVPASHRIQRRGFEKTKEPDIVDVYHAAHGSPPLWSVHSRMHTVTRTGCAEPSKGPSGSLSVLSPIPTRRCLVLLLQHLNNKLNLLLDTPLTSSPFHSPSLDTPLIIKAAHHIITKPAINTP